MGYPPHYALQAAGDLGASVRIMDAIRALVHELHVSSCRLQKETGASLAQLFALRAIAEQPSESVIELASRLATHQSSVSAVLRRLQQKGLIERPRATVHDRRLRAFVVTAKGQNLLRRSPRMPQARLVAAFRTLSVAERHVLSDLLVRWRAAAGLAGDWQPLIEDE